MPRCLQCGFDNPQGNRFCGNCGTRLGEAEALPMEPFSAAVNVGPIPSLLERFQQAGSEAAGQRRNVTVLFADLSGYTGLAGRLDNEDVYELIQQFIRLLIDEVYKYEGVVDKLTGDGLMALFGAPITYENNAERALRAAWDMQTAVTRMSAEVKDRLRVDLKMRVGLHTGSVIVGNIGSDMHMDYTAIGDTVNLAHRLEETAQPGTILASESVYRQTQRLFEFSPVSGLALKGVPQSITAYQMSGIKASPGSLRGLEGLRAPMVGREQEMDRLKQVIAAQANWGYGAFVMVTGEAGIGKSRLTAELKGSLDLGGVRILEASSLTFRRSVSYWIFLDLLRKFLEVTPATPETEIAQRLAQATEAILGKRAGEYLPYLEHFLSLPPSNPAAGERIRYLDASQLRQQIFIAYRELILGEAARQPLMIILEDLHWADEASLDLLAFLLESVRRDPLIIYAISRPFPSGELTKITDWAAKHLEDRYRLIQLESLSLDQSDFMLQNLLDIPDFPNHLRRYILAQAAGVPFYLEEILRMLMDGGILLRQEGGWVVSKQVDIENLGVPDTLQGLIMARFDRLNEPQQKVLQVASVIGHQFSLVLLKSLLPAMSQEEIDPIMDELTEREFIFRSGEPPNTHYTFRHMLMSEAIYSTILKRERGRLHGQVGEAIEAIYPSHIAENIELLARHYSWSPVKHKALHYCLLAGQRAARSYLSEQANKHYQQALELLPTVEHTPEQARHVYMGLGDLESLAGDYSAAYKNYELALETYASGEPSIDLQELSALQRNIAKILDRQGEYELALERLEIAEETEAQASGQSPVERAHILNDKGWIYFRKGNYTEAEKMLNQALALVENTDAFDAIASIYNRLGGIAYSNGDWNRTADYLRKSIAIREAIGDMVGLATSFNNLGLLGIEMGDFGNALENLTRSYELKTNLGQTEGIAMTLNNLGWLQIQRGELQQADQCLNQALDLARQIGYTSLKVETMKNLGELYLVEKDWDKSRQVLSETIGFLIMEGSKDQLVDTYRLLGEAHLAMGDTAQAKACVDKIQSLTISFSENTRDLSSIQRGEFWRFCGMLATAQGEWESASRYLKTSDKIFQGMNSRLHQGRVAYQLGALAEAQGDRRTAQLRYREAALLFRSVGARLEQQRSEEATSRQ